MNRLLIGLLVVLSASSLAAAQSGDGTALWWKLDETSGTNVADSSGNNLTGTRRSAVATPTDKPTLLYANPASTFFSGATGVCIDQVNKAPFNAIRDTFTYSFWVKPTASLGLTAESNSGVSGTSGQRYVIFPAFDDASPYVNGCGVGISVGTNGVRVFEHYAGYLPSLLAHNVTISNTVWTHIAVIYNDRTPSLYINGAWVRTGLQSTRTDGIHPGSYVGGAPAYPWYTYGPYAGGIDEVRLYPRALATFEISRLAAGNLDAGTPPSGITNVQQSAPLVGSTITFSADITDANAQVLLEVEVRPAGSLFSGVASATSALKDSGNVSLTYTIPGAGPYDWRYRAGNASRTYYTPWTDFAPVSPDFVSDQTGPSTPTPVWPVNADAPVATRHGGAVAFTWTMATDNGTAPVTYDVVVSTDPDGIDLVTSATGVTGNSVSLDLPTAEIGKFWAVRAKDAAGNVGAWSAPSLFRVVFEDGVNHGAGDATKACGFSAPGAAASLAVLLALLLLRR